MFVPYIVASAVLALLLTFSAWAKLTRNETVVTTMTGIGVPLTWFPYLATCEVAGAVGLLAGIVVPPLGIAAAIGVILYFAGAVYFHLRAHDKAVAPPLVILIIAVAALVLRIAAG
ncbi:MAG TPA: DoxX family protein [Pseudonocardiaceae bacterium]|jgi:hypothetical protein